MNNKKAKFNTVEFINENSTNKYKHLIEDKTLYITKDNITISLCDDEIMELLEKIGVAGGDFKNGYKGYL